jgi:hypothetical protein
MEWFLSNVCTNDWNVEQDRGRDWDEAVALLVKDHPGHEPHIRAFHERWSETVSGIFENNVALLQRLREQACRTTASRIFPAQNSSGPGALSVPRRLRRHHRLR